MLQQELQITLLSPFLESFFLEYLILPHCNENYKYNKYLLTNNTLRHWYLFCSIYVYIGSFLGKYSSEVFHISFMQNEILLLLPLGWLLYLWETSVYKSKEHPSNASFALFARFMQFAAQHFRKCPKISTSKWMKS